MRELKARFAGTCGTCQRSVPVGERVLYDAAAKRVHCLTHSVNAALPEAPPDSGQPTAHEPEMRTITTRRAGACSLCERSIAAGTTVRWDPASRRIACVDCSAAAAPAPGPGVLQVSRATKCAECSIPIARGAVAVAGSGRAVLCVTCGGMTDLVDAGTAGESARREHLERRETRDTEIRSRHKLIGGLILAIAPDDADGAKWGKGAVGEERLGPSLGRVAGEVGGFVLHDRGIPGSSANLDHLVVVPAGVFVVDSKRWSGKIEVRDVGGWFKTDMRVFVGGRNRTSVVQSGKKQAERVTRALRAASVDESVTCSAAMCFVEGEWPLLSSNDHVIDGVRICPPRVLYRHLKQPGELSADECKRIAQVLASAFPVKQ